MHPILHVVHAATVLSEDQARIYHTNQNRDCKRTGLSTREYHALCMQERVLHRWYEAESKGFIQRDDPTKIPWGYSPEPFGDPLVRSDKPLPDDEAKAIAMAKGIAGRHGFRVFTQNNLQLSSLYLYRDVDLGGTPIEECYPNKAIPIMFPR